MAKLLTKQIISPLLLQAMLTIFLHSFSTNNSRIFHVFSRNKIGQGYQRLSAFKKLRNIVLEHACFVHACERLTLFNGALMDVNTARHLPDIFPPKIRSTESTQTNTVHNILSCFKQIAL